MSNLALEREFTSIYDDAVARDRIYVPNAVDDKNLYPLYAHTCWETGNLLYKMHDGQIEIFFLLMKAKKNPQILRFIILCCRRFGKSVFVVLCALMDCITKPGSEVFILGPSIIQTWGIVSAKMRQICKDAPNGLIKPSTQNNCFFVGSSIIYVRSFDSIDSSRGYEGASIYIEETREIPASEYDYINKHVLAPMTSHTGALIIDATTPPEDPGHPFCVQDVPVAMDNDSFYRATIDQNPTLTPEARQRLIDSCGGPDSIAAKRELYADHTVADRRGVVIASFDKVKAAKVSKKLTGRVGYLSVTDNATHKDHTFSILFAYEFESDTLHAVDERVWKTKTSTEAKVTGIREMEAGSSSGYRPAKIFDCSSELIEVLAESYNYPAAKANTANRFESIAALDDAIGSGRFVIHDRCVELKAVMDQGRWNKTGTDFKRTDDHGHLDGIMAAVYGWKHRKDASDDLGYYVSNSHYERFDGIYSRCYVGVAFYRDNADGYYVMISDRGQVLASGRLTGASDARFEIIRGIASNHSNVSLICDFHGCSELLVDQVHSIGVPVFEESIKSDRDSLFSSLRDSLENGHIMVDSLNPIFDCYLAYKNSSDDARLAYPSVDAFMLSSKGLMGNVLRQVRISRGGLIKPDDIGTCSPGFKPTNPGRSVMGVVFSEGRYSYVIKRVFKYYNAWVSAGNTPNILDIVELSKGVRDVYIQNDVVDVIEDAIIDADVFDVIVHEFEFSTDEEMVDGFKQGRELFPKEDWAYPVIQCLSLFPDEGREFVSAAYPLDMGKL